MLVTGTRMANGSVLAEMSFFNVEPGKTSDIKLEMRESQDDVQVIGNFNSENKFKRADNGEETSLLATTGRGYYVVAVLGARQEPTNHAMRVIAAVKKDLEEWAAAWFCCSPMKKASRTSIRRSSESCNYHHIWHRYRQNNSEGDRRSYEVAERQHTANLHHCRHFQPCSVRFTRLHNRLGRSVDEGDT